MTDLTELFCDVDDFVKNNPIGKQNLLPNLIWKAKTRAKKIFDR
jgi:hypothetical protein